MIKKLIRLTLIFLNIFFLAACTNEKKITENSFSSDESTKQTSELVTVDTLGEEYSIGEYTLLLNNTQINNKEEKQTVIDSLSLIKEKISEYAKQKTEKNKIDLFAFDGIYYEESNKYQVFYILVNNSGEKIENIDLDINTIVNSINLNEVYNFTSKGEVSSIPDKGIITIGVTSPAPAEYAQLFKENKVFGIEARISNLKIDGVATTNEK